jgi:hypothetical protein
MNCFYFGCWNKPGHFLVGPGGTRVPDELHGVEYHGNGHHIDGTLAPLRHKYGGQLRWSGQAPNPKEAARVGYDSEEYPQGQFLLHHLDNGYTAISWWDRTQGDTRGACNSTILLEGRHTSAEMLEALRTYFPHVLANLTKAGVELVDVTPP